MADNLKQKLASLGGKLRLEGAEVGRKMSTSVVSVREKMKELLRTATPADKVVEDLTSEDKLLYQNGPDWSKIMELCDAIRSKEMSGQDVAKAFKKRLMLRIQNANTAIDTNARVQLLTLALIEACVKNCESLFVDISNEHVLDEMVKIVDDPSTAIVTRDKTLKLIEAWGESPPQLRNLPTFEETYKSLKSRGVKFPIRDPESLAPIFTPPRSVARSSASPQATMREAVFANIYGELDVPGREELLHTAQNSVDLLSTVLTSSPGQEVLQDELTTTLIEQCHRCQFLLQRVVEQVGNDEALLFEALNINDELQKVIAKYEEMQAAFSSGVSPSPQSTEGIAIPAVSSHSGEETELPSNIAENKGVDTQ